MSYVAPELREYFENLSINQKNRILEQNVQLYSMQDLIRAIEQFGNSM